MSVPPRSMQMINDLHEWRELLKNDIYKSHVDVIEGLEVFVKERIKVRKEEARTRTFNQSYDKLQAKKDMLTERYLLGM